VTSTTTYSYDPAGRLSGLGQDFAGTASDLSLGFSYNPASQIVSNTRSNDAFAWGRHYNFNRGYTANGLDRYSASGPASLTYDANGNLVSDGSTSFVYDNENRLVSASGSKNATLAYDPLGRLWQISSSAGMTRFVYDGDRLTAEFSGAGALLRSYAHGPGADEPLTVHEPGVAARFIKTDERGSVIATADASGNPAAINAYDEYGIPASANTARRTGRPMSSIRSTMPAISTMRMPWRTSATALG
jgi:hypothetical protein